MALRYVARWWYPVPTILVVFALPLLLSKSLPQIGRDSLPAHVDWSSQNKSSAVLRGAGLRGARLLAANLTYADLSNADLSKGDFCYSSLNHANLRGADLRGANLRWADFRDAMLDDRTQIDPKWRLVWEIVNRPQEGRVLRDVDLSEANMRGLT